MVVEKDHMQEALSHLRVLSWADRSYALYTNSTKTTSLIESVIRLIYRVSDYFIMGPRVEARWLGTTSSSCSTEHRAK